MAQVIKPATLSEFNKILKKNKKPTVVMFAPSTYLYRNPMEALFIKQATKYNVPFMEVETDHNKETRTRYRVTYIPAYMVINANGYILWSITGVGESNVNKAIDAARKQY